MNATQSNQVVLFDKLMDSDPLFLTGNTDTVYASVMLDLRTDGPTVVEIPPQCGPGTVNTPAMAVKMVGKGSQYAYNARDREGNYLDGGKAYRLNIPANVPAKDFWSVVVYDPQTRPMLQTSQEFPSKNNMKHKLDMNADGSVDLYFGPKAPERHANNWIETIPGKGWMVLIRLYGPLEPWFDKTWRPGEFELLP